MNTYVLSVTPLGEGGISIIHLIGPKARPIISQAFRPKRLSPNNQPLTTDYFTPRRLYLGHIYNKKRVIDEVIINFIPARASFSGLDTIEINAHGGFSASREIIRVLTAAGAKPITQGRLINLAVRQGRLNKVQKFALEDLLSASTGLAAEVFMEQFRTGRIRKQAKTLIDAIRHPKRVVIVGRPNTGKSTLFNAIVGKDKAIVHHLPGTTRDNPQELIAIKGIPFILIDSAGVRKVKKGEIIEQLGIRKTLAQVRRADIILLVLDSSEPLQKEDMNLLNHLKRFTGTKQVIYVLNKSDLSCPAARDDVSHPAEARFNQSHLKVSALRQTGIERLKSTILRASGITA